MRVIYASKKMGKKRISNIRRIMNRIFFSIIIIHIKSINYGRYEEQKMLLYQEIIIVTGFEVEEAFPM